MRRCPSCGAANPEFSSQCQQCAAVLPAQAHDAAQEQDDSGAQGGSSSELEHLLLALAGALAGKVWNITATGLNVGRSPVQSQLLLADPEISRRHAHLFFAADGSLQVEDLSSNGTYLNGRKVKQAKLNPGDRIRFGLNPEYTFVYETRAVGTGPASSLRRFSPPVSPPLPTVGMPNEMGVAAPLSRLQLVIDQYVVQSLPLSPGRFGLGRAKGPAMITIDHPDVAERQGELVVSPSGETTLRNLGAPGGTSVNREQVSERKLCEGDLIQLGSCESRLLLYRDARARAQVLREIELAPRGVTRLGRDPGNDSRLDHPTVSRFHAEIRRVGRGYELVDCNSTNGTFVDGARITRRLLQPWDSISVGAVQLVFDGEQIEERSAGVWVRAYDLQRTGHSKLLLDRVSLAVGPREFVGVLGPSGSGKTTLLHALSGFQPADGGRVTIDELDLYSNLNCLRARMGQVPQEDILLRSLTVEECLRYAARLRLPDDTSEESISQRVAEVTRAVELGGRAGKPINTLSGGQRKRVSVAMELLSAPGLLFLDEPAAGQDPLTEKHLMQLLRKIANEGATVIMTTHLLGAYSLLDKVVVIVEGCLAYCGPGQDMPAYFSAAGPQDVYEALGKKKGQEWAREFRKSKLYTEQVANPLGEVPTEPPAPVAKPRPTPLRSPASSALGPSGFTQLRALLTRILTLKSKDWTSLATLVLAPPVIALLLSLMLGSSPNNPKSLFLLVIVALWLGCSAAVREIVDELAVYRRERQGGLRLWAYLGSKLAYLAGLAVVQSLLFVGVGTLLGAFENHFAMTLLIMWVMTVQGALIGLLISAMTSSAEKALAIFPLALIPQLLLAGLFIPTRPIRQLDLSRLKTDCGIVDQGQSGFYSQGMPPVLRYGVSPFMVARWGLEDLADLFIHDRQYNPADARGQYSLPVLSYIAVTFHPDEEAHACQSIQAQMRQDAESSGGVRDACPIYNGILAAFGAVMITAIALVLKRKEKV